MNELKRRHRLRIVVPSFPTFNIFSQFAPKMTALGPVCVATAVKDIPGWDVEIIDENNLGKYGPKLGQGADHAFLQQERPVDVVGFYGGLTSTIPRLYELARFYQSIGVPTIAGGQHFTGHENRIEALSSGIDYLVIGEGEETIQDLLPAMQGSSNIGHIRGISYLDQGKVISTPEREATREFDQFAYPDFSLVRYAKIKIFSVERVRGCPMQCEFCTVKSRPRYASIERFIKTFSYLVETHNARHFLVTDDLFGQQRDETIQFCRMLRDYQERIGKRLSITVQIRLDKACDPELLSAMRLAGINNVAIGLESPIDEELQAMKKQIKSKEMLSLVRIFRQFGFWVHGMFIFGYPAVSSVKFNMSLKERIRRFRRFIRKARIDSVQVLLPIPLPGTELRNRLEKQDRVYSVQAVGWEYYDGNFPLFEPDAPMTAEGLQYAVKKIMTRFYQFHYVFAIIGSILTFPALVFSLHRLERGWGRWVRKWRSHIIRFAGWLTIKKWTSHFMKDPFLTKVSKARKHLCAQHSNG